MTKIALKINPTWTSMKYVQLLLTMYFNPIHNINCKYNDY